MYRCNLCEGSGIISGISAADGSEELANIYHLLAIQMKKSCKRRRTDEFGNAPCRRCVERARKVVDAFKEVMQCHESKRAGAKKRTPASISRARG
jgi:hypothetical protein